MGYFSGEVTGYVVNECVTLCPNCFKSLNFKENESTTIFVETETESTCTCENCKNEIMTSVID